MSIYPYRRKMTDIIGIDEMSNVQASIRYVDNGQMEFMFSAAEAFPFNRPGTRMAIDDIEYGFHG